VRDDLPTGTVTFLFTDIEGSTRLLRELGPEAYASALVDHRNVCRAAFAAEGGVEVDTQGDAFFAAFSSAPGAVGAARRIQTDLSTGPISLRVGIHTGTPLTSDGGYVGLDVHRAARIAAAASGGQILVSAPTATMLTDDDLLSLGHHRLKDFDDPIEVFQCGTERFPPIRSVVYGNLVVPTSSFVGRKAELATGAADLARTRILTVLGPGGVGKTRFAIELARLARDDYAGGVWFVPLGSIDDPGLVIPTIATVLGIPDSDDPVARLGERVAGASTLLVVDTVEQVIDSSVDLARLSRAVPALTIIATSREPMRIDGERLLDLPPMGLQDASALFVERARASGRIVATDDPTLRELCRRLDGLPLAVELVAARSRVLDLRQLSQRLDDRLDLAGRRDADPRQRTLRATIGWSHDLLDEGERSAFARLSVFAGEWDLEAAEKVCGADPEIVVRLADRSLIRTHRADDGRPGRFSLLDTIRVFAAEQLEARDDRPWLTGRLDGYLLDTAVARAPRLKENDQLEAFAWFDMSLDDLRGAVKRLLEASDARAAGLVLALVEYLWRRGLVHEEDTLIEAALLQHPGEIERGRLLRSRGISKLDRADAVAAERDLVEARSVAIAAGQQVDAASASYTLAHALLAQDRNDEARALFDQVASSSGDARLVALCHWGLGGMARDAGDADLALEELGAARRFHRSIQDRLGVAWIDALMGQILVERGSTGDSNLACAALAEAFDAYAHLGASPGLLDALTALGFLALPAAPDVADQAARWVRRILDGGYAPETQDALGIEGLERALAAAGIPPASIPEGYGIEAANWAQRAVERLAS